MATGYFDANGTWHSAQEQEQQQQASVPKVNNDPNSTNPYGAWWGTSSNATKIQDNTTDWTKEHSEAMAPQYNARQQEFEQSTNWDYLESQLRAEAAARGAQYDPSDLEGIRRNAGYDATHLGDAGLYNSALQKYYTNALGNYDVAGANTNGPSDGGSNGQAGYGQSGYSSNGYPTPARTNFSNPVLPAYYQNGFQAANFTAPIAPGYDQRNVLVNAILNNPETMGQTFQDQLFESQKELLNASNAQSRARLGQDLTSRGFSNVGGQQLAGQAAIEGDLTNGLLGARRDIATQAATQNRQDTLAAISMQQAVQAGDYEQAMAIFTANQSQKAQQEQFLQAAAQLNSSNQLQHNSQMLSKEVAGSNENMDFYRFLEQQRQAINDLNYRYYSTNLAATGA